MTENEVDSDIESNEVDSDIESDEVDSDIESNEDAAPNLNYMRVPRRYFIKQESAAKSEKVQWKVLRAPLMIVLNLVTVAAAIWVIWQTERWLTKHRMGLVNVNDLWFEPAPNNDDQRVPGLMNAHGFAMVLSLCVLAPIAACSKAVIHCGYFGDFITFVLWLSTLISFVLGMVFWIELKLDYGEEALPNLTPDKGMHTILSVPILILMILSIFFFAIRVLAIILTSTEYHHGTTLKITKIVVWINNFFGDDLMSHHLRRFIPICSFLALCSGLLTYHQIIFTGKDECRENESGKSCLNRYYPEWNSRTESYYWHAIFIGLIVMFVVQSCIGFYEHWLYFHGPDHIYHEKYHNDFVKIAESIVAEMEEEAETQQPPPENSKQSVPWHKQVHGFKRLPDVGQLKRDLIGQPGGYHAGIDIEVDKERKNKTKLIPSANKIVLFPGHGHPI